MTSMTPMTPMTSSRAIRDAFGSEYLAMAAVNGGTR
jgi:hypothetical protein